MHQQADIVSLLNFVSITLKYRINEGGENNRGLEMFQYNNNQGGWNNQEAGNGSIQ